MDLDPRDLGRAGHRRAEQLERDLLTRWPEAWAWMDRMRADPSQSWPDWCLLPMAAAAAVATCSGGAPVGADIAALAASYAHRWSQSTWVIHPTLMDRLLTQIPDHIELADLVGLPEWCVHVVGSLDGEGLWMHLEHDVNTGRPELRLLLDVAGRMLPVPVYLDRPSLTEALADMHATILASFGRTGQDVRGGELDPAVVRFAEQVEKYVAVAAYLARPEADIGELGRPAVRPVRTRQPARGRRTWLVGYGG